MNRVNKRRLLVVGAVLLAVLSLVLFSLRDVVREVIVIPLSYLFWLIGILIESTAQLFFWLAVLFFGLLTAWRSIRPKKQSKEEEYYRPLTVDDAAAAVGRGRVGYWATRVNTLRLGTYYQSSFNEGVSRLLVDLLAYRHHLTNRQVEHALENGGLNVPPYIADFVCNNTNQRILARPDFFGWFFNRFREWLMRRVRNTLLDSENVLDPAVRRVITYMEEELEVTYDQSGR